MKVSLATATKTCRKQFGSGILVLSIAIASSAPCALAQAQAPVQPAMRALSGAHQDTTYGSSFAKPLTVWVTDSATQQSLSGIRVEFQAAAGIGLSDSCATTDEHGLASVMATGLAATTSSATAFIPNFPATRVSFDGLVVNKAVLTIVPVDMQAKVGSEIPAITDYTIQGFVHGDTEATAEISGTPVLSTTATDHSPHANYAIKGGIGTLTAPNYSFVAGFGTMAILGNPSSEQNGAAELASEGTDNGSDAAAVRPALENEPSAVSIAQPAFLAGLRGKSGVFVRAAIWQSSTASTNNLQNANTRSALPTVVANRQSAIDASVRAVSLPKLASTTAIAQPVTTHSMIPTASTSQPSYNGSAIRKAFNPPGTK